MPKRQTDQELQLVSRALFKTDALPPGTNSSALSLALFGWEINKESPKFAECHLCARKIGLWSFVENRDKALDVAGEHRWFCAWIYAEEGSLEIHGWKQLLNALSRKVSDTQKEMTVNSPLDVYRLMERILPIAR